MIFEIVLCLFFMLKKSILGAHKPKQSSCYATLFRFMRLCEKKHHSLSEERDSTDSCRFPRFWNAPQETCAVIWESALNFYFAYSFSTRFCRAVNLASPFSGAISGDASFSMHFTRTTSRDTGVNAQLILDWRMKSEICSRSGSKRAIQLSIAFSTQSMARSRSPIARYACAKRI